MKYLVVGLTIFKTFVYENKDLPFILNAIHIPIPLL